jgi:cardiolipin synthase A/B
VPSDIEIEKKEDDSIKSLRSKRVEAGRAKKRAKGRGGKLSLIRSLVWLAWVSLLIQAAELTWKRWLAILLLAVVGYVLLIFRPIEEEPKYGLDHEFAIESDEFLTSITGATDTTFLTGNRIDILNNGDEFYPEMLKAIEQARHSVTMEAYIYWKGDIGRRFAEAVAAKARAGLPVKLLLDAVGSSTISEEILTIMEEGGCEVRWYRPIHWYTMRRANNRTHRKSLILDGRIGFTGGAGIADHWLGNAQDPDHWRDIQIRIEGPAVATLQSGFARNWLETTSEMITGPIYYPEHLRSGPLAVQSILSSPQTGSSSMRILYYLSIVCARRSIYIANPYFIPDENAIEILVAAKQRGVDVKIMVAGKHNDNQLARYNSTRLYGRLLAAGVEIYEYQRTMLHQKFMVCDGIWSTVGTANFDNRSFAHNDENNVSVYDRAFAAKWEQIFRRDLGICRRVDIKDWRNRGLFTRLRELLFSFFRDQV